MRWSADRAGGCFAGGQPAASRRAAAPVNINLWACRQPLGQRAVPSACRHEERRQGAWAAQSFGRRSGADSLQGATLSQQPEEINWTERRPIRPLHLAATRERTRPGAQAHRLW